MQDEYNLYCNDEFIGTYDISAVAEQLNITEEKAKKIANTTQEVNQWRIVKLYKKKPDATTMKLLKEWDELTEPYRRIK